QLRPRAAVQETRGGAKARGTCAERCGRRQAARPDCSFPRGDRRGKCMIVAGVMSGTSADGINVALVRILGRGYTTRFKLLAHEEYSYPTNIRRAVLDAMNAESISVAQL